MEAYLLDWANLLLRWLHVITAIAWVGSSFYFVFLDNNLIKPKSPDLLEKGVDGAMWAVHGGGFYNPQKYMVAPKKIHTKLHWFYWESYSTWISGFLLFSLMYLWNARAFLIDAKQFAWPSGWAAGLGALAFLAVFWLIYDAICRVFLTRPNGERWVLGCVVLVVGFMAWLACELFAGRAAFLIVGAAMATAMSANVFFWIIPGQKKVVAAMMASQEGGAPHKAQELAIHGKRGKQRSVHNTYFTLPVLFAMLSNHYGFLYGHALNWVWLIVLMAAGALIRQFFVQRHAWQHGRSRNPWPYAAVGVGLIAVLIVAMSPAAKQIATSIAAVDAHSTMGSGPESRSSSALSIDAIMAERCVACHSAAMQMKNLRVDSAAAIERNAQAIYQQVVVTRQMPMNNSTGITEAEREAVKAWFEAKTP
jgi:uncharacterized membrane protein